MRKISFIFFILFSTSLFSQEAEFPLGYNPVLIKASKNGTVQRSAASPDTLALPFHDDFSYEGIYPDQTKWQDFAVFINRSYSNTPPTLGVATFDGLNANGLPYTFGLQNGRTDSLTSKPINLSNLLASDSVYLSFYYQRKGKGDMPETTDSLILEYHPPADSGVWKRVWFKTGLNSTNGDTAFKFENHRIIDPSYLQNGFQFRFRTYGGRYGNVDLWHIDYVYLNINRTKGDSAIKDVGFVHPVTSFLKDYESVPWSHYLASPVPLRTVMPEYVRNLESIPNIFEWGGDFYDKDGNVVLPVTSGNSQTINGKSVVKIDYNISGNPFPPNSDDHAHFIFKGQINFNDDYPTNQTVNYVQRFYDYYAYDDGTAEAGYGVLTQGAQVAYRFNMLKQDTLKAVQMFFTYMVNDVRDKNMTLMVWADNNGKPGTVLFRQNYKVQPQYDGLTDFHIYDMSEANLVLSGTFYIGWEQETNDILNIGVDKSRSSASNMFYTTTGNWYSTQFSGSWMIRPMFGKRYPYAVSETIPAKQELNVYPNPVSDRLNMELSNTHSEYEFIICDISGREVKRGIYSGESIDVSDLNSGLYLIRAGNSSFRKFVISR